MDEGSDKMTEEIWTPGKKKMKTLGTRIYSSRTNSEEKEFLGDDEIIIRIMLYLSSSNLIDDKQRILHTTYSSWKGLRSDISQTWEGLH